MQNHWHVYVEWHVCFAESHVFSNWNNQLLCHFYVELDMAHVRDVDLVGLCMFQAWAIHEVPASICAFCRVIALAHHISSMLIVAFQW